MSNDAIVSFHTVDVYEKDLKLIATPRTLLNDTLLHFCFDYFGQVQFKDVQGIRFIVPASTVILIHEQDDDGLVQTFKGLQIDKNIFSFFAVNDCGVNIYDGHGGGSHWSLVVYSLMDNTCVHFDSSFGMNDPSAAQLAAQLSRARALLFQKKSSEEEKGRSETPVKFVQCGYCPQQGNSYDCGIFTLSVAECLAEKISEEDVVRFNFKEDILKPVLVQLGKCLDATMKRKWLKDTIEALSNRKYVNPN